MGRAMNSLQASEDANTEQTLQPLHGSSLFAVRVVWVVLAILTLSVFVASTFARSRQMNSSPEFYAVYVTVLDVAQVLVYFLAAAAIFWRRANDRMAILVSIALLMFGVAIVPKLNILLTEQSVWRWPTLIVQALGLGLTLIVFYTFPDGRPVPRWTRALSFVWIGWLLAWSLSATIEFDVNNLPLSLQFLVFLVLPDNSAVERAFQYIRVFSLSLIVLAWLGSGVFAQIYRYTHVSTPVQRQQTKWAVFGLTAAVVGYMVQLLLVYVPLFNQPGTAQTVAHLIGKPISVCLLLFAPLSVGVSVLRRRLWAIDPIIKSTMRYGALTSSLLIVYLACVFLFQAIVSAFTNVQSDFLIVVFTLVGSAMVQPLRRRLQDLIDRRFYRESVDFRRTIMNFSRVVRTIIDMPELLRVLVTRTADLLHITHGAVFLREPDGTFRRTEDCYVATAQECQECASGSDTPPDRSAGLSLATGELGRLRNGRTVSTPTDRAFSLLVPLVAPRMEGNELVGVLALGPRRSGQDYSREDRALLLSLADQAGTAIYVARLIQEKEAEAQRREEVERRLEAHRNSPIGRAEVMAGTLLSQPETAIVELHRLAQAAGQDPNSASLLDNLPGALDSLGAEPIAKLAEGFNYVFTSQFEHEVLPVGLRTIITQLENHPDEGWQYAAEALTAYRLCQAVLTAGSIPQITQLLPDKLPDCSFIHSDEHPFHHLADALAELHPAAKALHAYERMDDSRDKLAYLASAVERLRHVEHLARTELGSADRPVVQHIAADWLAVVTSAIADLQTRAEIVCRLLTRHTWQEDVVPLVLKLRNEGRGAALNLQVTVLPRPEYELLDESAQVEQLAPGEEVRVELRVRPRLAEGVDQFRARFVITYTDPRGPDQVENFADVVRLLAGEGEFQFIPNPYVVGTPLEAGSPLFFGRGDVVAYIKENLAALHRNNLVLIGQRRTGKTSLLKQLPVQLGDDYLPVYLDGQALGLDPGLPNFFLALATEIAFALEDRDFGIALPEYEDFADSPTTSFERKFLARVREAIGDRHLLIMFDEFEALEAAVRRGNLDASIFGFLRHLIQHADNLSVIFCGTHRLEELASDYWNVLFNISLYRQIAFLEQPEALRLIQEPVAEHGMRYDDLALDKIWQVTAGHPYFLQLLCHSLVNQHNRTERGYVTVSDVNAALEDILASGEAHFVFLWTEATPEERLILVSLSRMIPLTGHVTLARVVDYLDERGVNLERRAISDALHNLTLRDVLTKSGEADPVTGEVYRWRMGLLGLWVEKYQSLNRVVDGVRG